MQSVKLAIILSLFDSCSITGLQTSWSIPCHSGSPRDHRRRLLENDLGESVHGHCHALWCQWEQWTWGENQVGRHKVWCYNPQSLMLSSILGFFQPSSHSCVLEVGPIISVIFQFRSLLILWYCASLWIKMCSCLGVELNTCILCKLYEQYVDYHT